MLENIIIFVKSFNLSPHQSFKWFLFLWSAAFIKSLFHTRLFLSSRILNFWGNHLSLTYHHTLYVLKFSHIFFETSKLFALLKFYQLFLHGCIFIFAFLFIFVIYFLMHMVLKYWSDSGGILCKVQDMLLFVMVYRYPLFSWVRKINSTT